MRLWYKQRRTGSSKYLEKDPVNCVLYWYGETFLNETCIEILLLRWFSGMLCEVTSKNLIYFLLYVRS